MRLRGQSIYRSGEMMVSPGKKIPTSFLEDLLLDKSKENLLHIKDAAIDSSIAGVVFASLNGEITYMNRSFLDMARVSENDSPSQLKDFFPESPKTDEMFGQLAIGGQSIEEHWIKRCDGSTMEASVTLSIVTDRAEKPIAAMLSCLDITEQKNAEREKRLLHTQLLHSAKLAEIGVLAASIIHEINTPLAIMKASTHVLKTRLGDSIDPKVTDAVNRHEIALDRVARIVNGLRRFARAEEDKDEVTNIHRVVEETMFLVKDLFKKVGINIETHLKSAAPQIIGQFGKLQQVLMNLISNGKDAIESKASKGGTIVIRTSDVGESIQLSISDDGCGIPEDVLAKMFDAFFTTKPAGAGTGLGLSISRSIVTSMKGEMSIESKVGQGTTFTFKFPRIKTA